MDGIWISPEIMEQGRTAAEKLLLARICYRAGMATNGACTDSNKVLAAAVGIHFQSVSELIRAFEKSGLVSTHIDTDRANLREIKPIRKILTGYKEKADRYKEKADTPYKEIPYTLYGKSLDPIRNPLRPYKENPYSLYKDIKLIKTLKEFSIYLQRNSTLVSESTVDTQPPAGPPPAPRSAPPPPPPETDWPAQLLADRRWLEGVQKNFRIKPDQLPPLLDEFKAECDAIGKQHPDYKDFRQHAYYWLRDRHTKQQRSTRQHDTRNAQPQLPAVSTGPGAVIRNRTYTDIRSRLPRTGDGSDTGNSHAA